MRWDSLKALAVLCLSGASATFWPGYDGGVVARGFESQPLYARQGLTVTTNGMCGNGTTCLGSTTYGSCCSHYYWCGSGDDFCGTDCRTEFGSCGSESEPTPTTTSAGPNPTDLTITTNGMCGNGTTCLGSTTYGSCCSYYYWCGSGDDFCGDNCRSGFGTCGSEPAPGTNSTSTTTAPSTTTTPPATTPPANSTTTTPTNTTTTAPTTTSTTEPTTTPPANSTTTTPPANSTTTTPPANATTTTSTNSTSATSTVPTPTGGALTITTNGMCGNGTTCAGSTYGSCCSLYYWCGTGDQFCNDGCRDGFGDCGADVPPPPAMNITTTGACGNGTTCAGSKFGDCCSDFYYCGTGDQWCGLRCRPEFGKCD